MAKKVTIKKISFGGSHRYDWNVKDEEGAVLKQGKSTKKPEASAAIFNIGFQYRSTSTFVNETGDTDFDTVLETGGAKTGSHTLTVNEIPSHTHTVAKAGSGGNSYNLAYVQGGNTQATGATGGGAAHTHPIVQPYIVVYMWRRTA